VYNTGIFESGVSAESVSTEVVSAFARDFNNFMGAEHPLKQLSNPSAVPARMTRLKFMSQSVVTHRKSHDRCRFREVFFAARGNVMISEFSRKHNFSPLKVFGLLRAALK